MSRLVATFCYIGLLRPAPGTWGSAAAIPVAYLIHYLGSFPALLMATLLVFGLGWWATVEETRGKDDHDPSEIVIDEVAGQWIAILPVLIGLQHSGAPVLALWPGWLTAFVAFRLFDVLKPGPIGWADRRDDPLGVMLDDIIAGVFAALTVALGAWISHGWLGL